MGDNKDLRIEIPPITPTYIGAPHTPPVPYVLVDGVRYEPIWDGKVWVYKQNRDEKE